MTSLLLPNTPLDQLTHHYLLALRMRNCSTRTVESWDYRLRRFLRWCQEREITQLPEITRDIIAAYRRHLYHYRNPKNHAPLKFATQASYLIAVRGWMTWLAEQEIIAENVAARVELPKVEERLPTQVLSATDVERVLNQTAVDTPLGLRDRAILEVFYSTAIRCGELTRLQVYDMDQERGILRITQGKGRKDRVVPIGRRALAWVATLMLENGADLRALQLLLGHERLTTTQLYTHVSITRLKAVHERTHPADLPRSASDETTAE